jgi:hypothetical protein
MTNEVFIVIAVYHYGSPTCATDDGGTGFFQGIDGE